MRKALTMLGAIAALALGSVLTAPANAQAVLQPPPEPGTYAGITCSYYGSGVGYPNVQSDGAGSTYFIDCSGIAANVNDPSRNAVYNTITGEPSSFSTPGEMGVKPHLEDSQVRFFYFNSRQEYLAWFTAAYQAQQNTQNEWPVTQRVPQTNSAYSFADISTAYVIIFKNGPDYDIYPLASPPVNELKDQEQLGNMTAHEIGHIMNFIWRSHLDPTQQPSDSDVYKSAVKTDMFELDYVWVPQGQTKVPTAAKKACGANGALNGLYDFRLQQNVCGPNGLRDDYKTHPDVNHPTFTQDLLNSAILNQIYPDFFKPYQNDDDEQLHDEQFAELYAIMSAHRVQSTIDNFASTHLDTTMFTVFGCTKGVVQGWRTQDRENALGFQCARPLGSQPWPTHPVIDPNAP